MTGTPRFGLSPEAFAAAFPFHFAIGPDQRVLQAGASLLRLCPGLEPGHEIAGAVSFHRPALEWTPAGLERAVGKLVVLRVRRSDALLRGEFVRVDGALLFLGSPWLTSPGDLTRFGLTMSDFALHDPVVDWLQLHQAQATAMTDVRRVAAALEERGRQLELARSEALAASRAKSEFLANMSHEIRTPLNAVIALTDLLLRSPLDAGQRERVETIQSSGDALLRIISDILDLSKIEAGRLDLERGSVDIRACVEESVQIATAGQDLSHLAVHVVVAPDVPDRIVGDATRVRQILLNLVSNAVKFTPAGHVTIEATAPGGPDGPTVRFAVTDSGIGIEAGRIAALFDPFTQADASTTRKFGGTGLGLAICQRLVTAMGGTLDVQSEVGAGSTFAVRLPALPADGEQAAAASESAPPAAAEPGPGGRLRILVAEDHAVNREVVRLMIERLGHAADIVENGRAAVAALEAGEYDVVLMDVQMPELDGLEATREIRRRELGGAPRIIALTANALSGDREACLEAGMDDYVSKPVHLDALESALALAPRG